MTQEVTPVDALMAEHESLLAYLLETGETSFHSTLEGTVPKVFLLAAASWMETRVRSIMLDFFRETARDRPQTFEFIRRNAIEMKYHTFFEWRDRKPGKFFALFGNDMKSIAAKLHKEDAEYAAQYDAFLELGDLRNQLVHGNYVSFTLVKTAAEVEDLYRQADKFVDRLPALLRTDLTGEETPS